jgi:hypothetical protein
MISVRLTTRSTEASAGAIGLLQETLELLEFHGLHRRFFDLDLDQIKFQKMIQYLRRLLTA